MIFFSEHFQQLMWKNSRPVSNSARVSFNTVTFQYSSVGTRRKTHFWLQGGGFFFFHHILLKTGSPDCDSTDFWFFIFHHLPSCLPPFSNSQFYSWCKKTLLASNKTLNEIQERGSIDCIWLQSHFNPFPLHVRALDWRELQAEGGRGADALVFSRGPCALLTCLDSSVAAVIRSALTGKQGVCGRTWS